MTRHTLPHRVVAQHATQSPTAIAAVADGRHISYGEFETEARRMACFLRRHGAGPGRAVGVRLTSAADLIVALLGVWKTGAAFVLLPGSLPGERLASITRDAGISLLLSVSTSAPDPESGVEVLCLDMLREEIASCPDEAGDQANHAADPAFISYGASDSGLVVDWGTLAAYAPALAGQHDLSPSDRVVFGAPLDEATVYGALLATLVNGATAVFPALGDAPAAAALPTAVAEFQGTVLAVPHPLLAGLAELSGWPQCPTLRLVRSDAPDLDPGTDAETYRRLSAVTTASLAISYGQAVCGLPVTLLDGEPGHGAEAPLLGAPLDGTRVAVLDEFGEPLPSGLPGELHVAVSGAWAGRSGATAERFLPDPDGEPGSRMLRTGALVRWRNDGTLEHLGRAEDDADPMWDEEPLLLLDSERPPYVAPRTPEERAVAEVWAELLDLDDIGATDDFFQLGGYSLLLAKLSEQLRLTTGKDVALADLYQAVTVEQQAELVRTAGTARALIETVARDEALPLSFGQRRVWLLSTMNPDSAEWIVPLFLRLPGDIAPDTVRRALEALSARHESLRTRYISRAGEPLQIIEPAGPVDLRVIDGPTNLERLVREEFEAGFDLASGTLWRALLARRADQDGNAGQEQLLFLTVHHIACDGWSATVLEREFREICAAYHAGREPELDAPGVQYADYAVWQRKSRDKDSLTEDLAFWREELRGAVPAELPTDRPRPAERDPRGALVPVRIPAPLAEQVIGLGRRHEASPFMTLLTAFSALLARYSGQWDVSIGVPVAGRTLPETEPVVGFFINSLVLRCPLDPGLSFSDALDQVRETSLAAFAHQEVPFEHLVEELRPERDLSRTPLYQVAFNFNDVQVSGGMPGDGDFDLLLGNRQVSKTDLTLYLRTENDGALTGVVEYATALFERGTVERFASHFVQLLTAAVAAPASRLSTLDILPAEERGEGTGRWNDTRTEWDTSSALDVIEAQVAKTPEALALVAGQRRISYREMDRAANRIAHRLRSLGAGPDTLVGVCLHRGPELIESLLGVWKAGAAYVPIDPANPSERLNHVLADSGASILVSSSGLTELTRSFPGARLTVDQETEWLAEGADTPPSRSHDPERLAYVIYTSGSTGKPKGVMVTQHGLTNHLRWAARDLVVGEGGAPLFSSIAFDLPATNVYAPLMAGQPVHLLSDLDDLTGLGQALAASGPYSFIKLTPGHLDLLSHQLSPEQAAGLANVVLVAGEALPAKLANDWLELLGPGRLINEYGPTETSIGTTIHPVQGEQTTTVPLGSPLPNMTTHVLDDTGRPVPGGVIGELYIGGDGLARGYLDRPALTAERFVPNPFGGPGTRLYRTGDLVRRLPDGAIAFLGRVDDQVKIRGYRIELGEIEAALTDQPGVDRAAVVVQETQEGEKSLVAYLVGAADRQLDADAVRERVAEVLPAYMVPSAVAVLDALPLTPNGKLDRKALPSVDRSADRYEAPATPVEEHIAEIWSDILGRERISVQESFFEIGGHSILAIRMTSTLQDEFGIDLSLRTVFEHPTVRSLAAAVEDHIRAEIEQMSEDELREYDARTTHRPE
ncbi:non-ribosomal peptide synthetase [Streptomyces filipinensis]|uniref:non-ribosomal peptide synthetase n=1 Tax=Streptomyces filipinensis TaxID=66887 RepID=UPI00177A870D|nr:non-ribosomal peptide synthetase [Streptomyces filipinensis]